MKPFQTLLLLTLLTAPALADAPNPATPQPLHPIAADVLSQIVDDGPFHLHVHLTVKPEMRSKFIASMKEATAGTRLEAANREYQLTQIAGDKNTFCLCEQWTGTEGLSLHLSQPYVEQLLEVIDAAKASELRMDVFVPIEF